MSNLRNLKARTKVVLIVGGLLLVFFIAIQFVGPRPTNPEVTRTIQWDSPQTEALMRTACYDCHSNETVWPWYSYIAPASWLVVRDVNEGRRELNFSTGRGELEARELIEQIRRGSMPPSKYLILHPDANLSAEQQAQLIAGIENTNFFAVSELQQGAPSNGQESVEGEAREVAGDD